MAFLGDLIVKMGANVNPFTSALKKAQTMTKTFRDSLNDMQKTASVFAKLAASIKAVNTQMDRLITVSRKALDATQNMAKAEHLQAMHRMRQLKMLQSMQPKSSTPSLGGMFDVAGGIGIASGISSAVGVIKNMAIETVKLSATAEVMKGEFAVLLGNAEKGGKFFGEIEKFAARTSFNLESAADASRSLMAAGVNEGDLLDTMQLLGDLAMGDANKLGFLAKAYTDVFNKGRLQGQELKQFAENGVGVIGALATMLKKQPGEILAMSEAGQISFSMLQEALRSLTAEGGRFHGAMATRNNTLMGQYDSLVEAIQKTGRSIGESMLPRIKEVVAGANDILQKFNELPDKMEFLGNVFEASFDVAFETIKLKWDKMLVSMLEGAIGFSADAALVIADPLGAAGRMVGQAGAQAGGGAGNLDAANARLQGLLKQVKPDAKGPVEKVAPANDLIAQAQKRFDAASKAAADYWLNDPALNAASKALDDAKDKHGVGSPKWMKADEEYSNQMRRGRGLEVVKREASAALEKAKKEPQIREGGEKMKSGVASLWESLQAPLAEAQMAAEGMWERGKIKAGAAMGTLENIFTGETKTEPEKKIEPRLAGAMQKGSSEAYSTIVQAMLTRGKDPVVRATEKQTKDLIKGLKPAMAPPAMLVAFSEL